MPYVGNQVVNGAQAQQFIDRVDASTDHVSPEACLTVSNVEILPLDAAGTLLTPLRVTGTCNQVMITNGESVRYVPDTVISAIEDVPTATDLAPVSGESGGSPPR
jgi:hypothetical protein